MDFHVWLTVPSEELAPLLIAQLVTNGYTVGALSSDGATHWNNKFCALIALKIQKKVSKGTKTEQSVVFYEIVALLKKMGAAWLSMIVTYEGRPTWSIGDIPETTEKIIAEKTVMATILDDRDEFE